MSYQQKLQELKAFLRPYKNQPKQGTEAWKAIRGIGGSELNMLLKDERRLIGQKCGLVRGMGDNILSCNWGSVMESVSRNIMSIIYRTPIFEASSIPSAEVPGKTYSMDGMGVVRYRCDRWNGIPYEFFMNLITLFEFKSLWSREPVPGVVYADYEPQVLSGQSDLPIAEIALYIESVLRVCRHEDLGNNPHVEDWVHRSRSPKNWLYHGGNPHRQLPMCYGFLGFYMHEAAIPDEPDAGPLIAWVRSGTVDFAKLESTGQLTRLFRWVRAGHIHVWHSEIAFQAREWARCQWFHDQRVPVYDHAVDMDQQAVEFQRWCINMGYIPLGTMGYKLLDINIVPVEKQPGYTRQFEPQIRSALAKIKQLNAIADPAERTVEYNRMYGIEDEPAPIQEDNSDVLDAFLI